MATEEQKALARTIFDRMSDQMAARKKEVPIGTRMTASADLNYPHWGGATKDDTDYITRPIGSINDEIKSETARRDNKDKPRFSLVSVDALWDLVEVLEFGAKKYDADNWKKGMSYKSVLDSLYRHLLAILDGDDYDPESGCKHIGHVLCNAMFLSHYMNDAKKYGKFDDREGVA